MNKSTNAESFICEKYHCSLTRQACADRRAALIERAGYRRLPTYPGCQECAQGKQMAAGIDTSHIAPRPWGRNTNKIQTTGGENMGYPNKIDNEKLKIMLADGKFTDVIAAEFGVVAGAVNTRIKRLGLTPNYRRKPQGGDARLQGKNTTPVAKPVRQSVGDLTYKTPESEPGQIIPVTLRLNIEVNICVNTERA